jgi:SagB-type dehydrogenase family enzyme
MEVILRKQIISFGGIAMLAVIVLWPHWTRELHSVEITDQRIALAAPKTDGATSVEKALGERRSIRDFSRQPLSVAEVSQLLWAAQGITASGGRRTAPSAGALYPLEIYLVANNVEGLTTGVYKYRADGHQLIRTVEGDKKMELSRAALGQTSVRDAAVVLLIAAVYERTTARYGERGVRYVHIEIGHVGQNVCLEAVALKLGAAVIGAFDDSQLKKMAGLAAKEEPLYLIAIGRK